MSELTDKIEVVQSAVAWDSLNRAALLAHLQAILADVRELEGKLDDYRDVRHVSTERANEYRITCLRCVMCNESKMRRYTVSGLDTYEAVECAHCANVTELSEGM